MFKNTSKKFVALAAAFSLYMPFSLASAQSSNENGMNILVGHLENQQNSTVDEKFFNMLQNTILSEASIIQHQTSALERLWERLTKHFNQSYITIHGRHIRSANDFANYWRNCASEPLTASRRLYSLYSSLRRTLPEFDSLVHDAVFEIYKMNET